jgi:hypothetical protein
MARPGRSEDTSEDTSVPIWLKLSAVDSAKMDQVLARPEFEGWTKGEWCLEIIQTALRYYTKPRPAGEAGRRRAPVPPAPAVEDAPPPAENVPSSPEPVLPSSEAAPPRAGLAPLPAKATPPETTRRTSPDREPGSAVPEQPQPRRSQQPRRAAQPRRPPEPRPSHPRRPPEPEPPQARRPSRPKLPQPAKPQPSEPEPPRTEPPRTEPPRTEPPGLARPDADQFASAEVDSPDEAHCSHPAEARDYQSGTCAACGAILWD